MNIKEYRTLVVLALVLAIGACGGIIWYYETQTPSVGADLSALASVPAVTPAPASSALLPGTTPAAPGTPPAPATSLPGGAQPKAEFNASLDAAGTIVALPDRLVPDMFAFDSLPFDAPVAEFPLVLVDQRVRTVDFVRDMELDPSMRQSEQQIIDQMRSDITGPVPSATTPTTPGGTPGEESASKL